MGQGTADFPDKESAKGSALARRLFQIDGISGVFLGSILSQSQKQMVKWFTLCHLSWQVLWNIMLLACL